IKNEAIRTNQIKACEDNSDQGCSQKNVSLPRHPSVDFRDLDRRPFLAFIVLHQLARNGSRKRSQLVLQCHADLFPRLLFLAMSRQIKRLIDSIPKLRERTEKIMLLAFCSPFRRDLLLAAKRILQVDPHALKLWLPGS